MRLRAAADIMRLPLFFRVDLAVTVFVAFLPGGRPLRGALP